MESKADKLKNLAKLLEDKKISKEDFEIRKHKILGNVSVGPSKEDKKDNNLKDFFGNVKEKYNKFKETQAKKKAEKKRLEEERRAAEEARINKILSGDIQPINNNYNLDEGESCYFEINAKRMATIDRIVEETKNKSKKKGVVGRAVVGGVLLGPLGALGGAATAPSKGKSKVTQKTVSKVEAIDTGKLLLTNKRFLFIGSNLISLPYNQVPSVEFPRRNKLIVKYEGMEKNEYFELTGDGVNDVEYYYKGLRKN